MKKWYESKTTWLNIVTTLIAIVVMVREQIPVPEEYVWILVLVTGILNIVLRVWFTDTEIEKKVI